MSWHTMSKVRDSTLSKSVMLPYNMSIFNHSEIYSYPNTTLAMEINRAYETDLNDDSGSENENATTYETVQ